jgi:hypothetical protein
MSLKQVTPLAQHFRAGEQRAVLDELGRHQMHFHRPDVILEPVHERAVVGKTTHERHRRMRVQVDEARDQHVPWKLQAPGVRVALAGLTHRSTSAMRPSVVTTA